MWPLWLGILVFVGAALIIALGGARLSASGDRLADRTGWGEAVFGAVLFGGLISISGIVMTVTAAARDQPSLAYANAVGGIAAQTTALAVADLFHRRANLEHAAASLPNMVSATTLMFLLSLGLLGSLVPEITVAAVHPMSVVLVLAYLYGLQQMRFADAAPGWRPIATRDTVPDEPTEESTLAPISTRRLWLVFLGAGAMVAVAGWAATRGAETIVLRTDLGASFVGGVLLGITNALPETITAIAAVRRGALTLAVAGVVGGNTFDVLNLVAGDVAYRGGSIYHAAAPSDQIFGLVALMLTAVLLLGLLRRERQGPANIGFESVILLALYGAAVVVVALV